MFVIAAFVAELPSVTNKEICEECNVIFYSLSIPNASILQHAEFYPVLLAVQERFHI
jgi:hypothetical protein